MNFNAPESQNSLLQKVIYLLIYYCFPLPSSKWDCYPHFNFISLSPSSHSSSSTSFPAALISLPRWHGGLPPLKWQYKLTCKSILHSPSLWTHRICSTPRPFFLSELLSRVTRTRIDMASWFAEGWTQGIVIIKAAEHGLFSQQNKFSNAALLLILKNMKKWHISHSRL